MGYKAQNRQAYTSDGIPYLWNSGDTSSSPDTGTEIKMVASDGTIDDFFGEAVAIGSGRIVVGSRLDDNANGSFAGAAYIFDLNGVELAKITASDGAAGDNFGNSVAVGNGKIVIGTRVGDAAYIFDLNGTELTKLTASDGAANDFFGRSVAIGNGRIVVGSRLDDNTNGTNAGAAYIFDLNGTELTKITASDGAAEDNFGWTVAVGNERIIVGAYGNDDFGSNTGSAYIFDLNGNEIAKLTASDAAGGDFFGDCVSIGSGRIIVGAYGDDDNGSNSGSAYIYNLDGTELTKITASDGAAEDYFGRSISVGEGRIIVGVYNNDANGTNAGAAYIFDLDGTELTKIAASDGAAGDHFGFSVAVGSGTIVVGANNDDNAGGSDAGAAYIYSTPTVYNLHDVIDLEKWGV